MILPFRRKPLPPCGNCTHEPSDHGDRALVACYVTPEYKSPGYLKPREDHLQAQREHSAERCACPGYRAA